MRLAQSLYRVGSDLVNVYLVEDSRGVTVIDAGLPGHIEELEAELRLMGRSRDDIRGVVLTHGDTDHIGFAELLRSESGIPIYVHEGDAPRARGEVTKKVPWGPISVRSLTRFLWYGARHGMLRIKPVRDVTTFKDGEILDLPGAPKIIHVPGHTPGSVAIHIPTVDAVFAGDTMTTGHVLTGVIGPQPAPFTIDPDEALASLARLESVSAELVLPGHGPPWSGGVADAVRRVREFATGGA